MSEQMRPFLKKNLLFFFLFTVSLLMADDLRFKLPVRISGPGDKSIDRKKEDFKLFINGNKMAVTSAETVRESLFATGFAYNIDRKIKNMEYFKMMLKETQAVRRPGAAALDLCYVACGRLDGFWEIDLSPWDTAAGFLLVEEAGGKVTAMSGDKYNIRSKSVLATNGAIHKETVELFNKCMAGS